MAIASLADVARLEAIPVEERLKARSVYEALAAAAERAPDKTAIIGLQSTDEAAPVRRITYAALLRRITQTANLLTTLGIGPEDVVTTLLPTIPEAFFGLWGAETAAIGNPVNWFLEPKQIAGIMREAGTKAVIACDSSIVPDIWNKVEQIRQLLPHLKVIRVGGTEPPPPGVIDFDAAADAEPGDRLRAERRIDWRTVAALFHTGGTTGLPKLAKHTHGGQIVQSWTNSVTTADAADDVFFNGLPQFHVGGAMCAGLAPLCAGQQIVLLTPLGLRNPNVVRDHWQLVERFRPTVIGGVPTSLAALLNLPREGFDLSSVKFVLTGGSAVPIEIARRFERELGIKVVEGYGMTEVHGYSSMNPAGGECRVGSVGFRVPYMEIRVADVAPDGTIRGDCATGEIGHVLMRGPQVFGGYLNPSHEKGTLLADGWLDSGDLGRFDAEGYLWLTGRAKDLIIRGGHNIDPLVIEEVLNRHPAVETAAAVGRPDAYAGELPMGFVQLRPGQSATPEELVQFCRENVTERAAAPVEVQIIETMPLTGVGKIFKPALRRAAVQLIVEREIAALQVKASVDVVIDPAQGIVARVALADGEKETAAEAIRGRLDSYTFKWELR